MLPSRFLRGSLRRFLSRLPSMLCCAAALACATAHAGAAPERPSLADYQHTAWSVNDGAPPRILGLAQTADGWLWLATADGLYRFDGMRFERFALPTRGGMNRDRIAGVYGAPNGDLYIGYFAEGISVLHPDGRVDDLPPQPLLRNSVGSIVLDPEGSVWAYGGSLQRLRDGRWEVIAEGPDWTSNQGTSMLVDGSGQVWVGNEKGVHRYDRATRRLVRVADGGGELLLAPDGAVWLAGGAGAMRLLATPGRPRPAEYVHGGGRWAGLFDTNGMLWLLDCPQPLCLMPAPAPVRDGRARPVAPDAAASASAPLQISGADAHQMLEDREGDIWLATENGLDRYRRKRFQRSGLAGSGARYSIAADGAGQAWAADHETGMLWRLRPDGAPEPVAGRQASVVAKGRDGALLVGGKRTVERRNGATVETFALPPGVDGKPRDHNMIGVLDDGRVLWTATMEAGLIGWRDGRWHGPEAFNLPDKIYQSAPAGPGQLWLATGDGALVFYDNDKLRSYDMRAVGMASAIFPGAPLAISGSTGLGLLQNGQLRMLRAREPEVLRNISGMVVTPDGDRWLNGAAGLVHVRAADWKRSVDDPAQALRYEWFGAADGYPGQAMIDTRWASAASVDGRNLWLIGTAGVVRLDVNALRRNRVAPQAMILSVAGDGAAVRARPAMLLPPGSRHLRIEFTAPALHMPERVRFQYRLDGVDGTWQDAGTRRAASYTNVGPGDYVFRVRAANEDGIPSMTEAALRLRVAPTLIQTVWFKLACAGALALLAALAYRYRVRYVTQRLTERLQVRTAERERIARTLHDTFLQTVHGLVLRVDAVAAGLPLGDRARAQLERVLADASRALGEGREQLHELRVSDAHVLEEVVAETVARLRATHGAIAVDVRAEGERRALAPAVAEDVAEIAREALRNAFAHSGAGQIRVAIDYGPRTLKLRVADDGRGLDEAVQRAGARSGHWGLIGMRERAARIGAALAIEGGPRQGTSVTLEVPAARAYAA